MRQTLHQRLCARENDYSSTEDHFRVNHQRSLGLHPLESLDDDRPVPAATVSIIVPVWNAGASLRRCLLSIRLSDFVIRYPERVQVILVDDGSTDGSLESIDGLEWPFEMLVLRQPHSSRAHAMNVGLAHAEGEVILSCDADMILAPPAIGEAVRRVQAAPRAVCVGFRRDVFPSASHVSEPRLREQIPPEAFEFWGDNRFSYHWDEHVYPGWPKNMFVASRCFKDLGRGRAVLLADGDSWSLPKMVYGALFAFARKWLDVVGGFDERFVGWGYEDTFFALKMIAADLLVVPVLSLCGIHLTHPLRSPLQWAQGRCNRRLLKSLAEQTVLEDTDPAWRTSARRRVVEVHRRRRRGSSAPEQSGKLFRRVVLYRNEDTAWRLQYLAAQGLWEAAAELLHDGDSTPLDRPDTAAEVFRRTKNLPALEHLHATTGADIAEVGIHHAFALCENGLEGKAIEVVQDLERRFPRHPEVRFLIQRGSRRHRERGVRFAKMGLPSLAAECHAAALLASGGRFARAVRVPGRTVQSPES